MCIVMRWTYTICFLGIVAGCAPSGSEIPTATTPEASPAVFNAENAPTVEFSVPDMMCEEGCAAETREILSAQNGVTEVKVDFPAKVVIVAIDEETFDADKALAALIDRGFDNSTLKTAQ